MSAPTRPRGTVPARSGARYARHGRPRPSMAARVVGVVGELLLTAGLLLALFVVWQVWWTDVVASAQQQDTVAVAREGFDGAARAEPTHSGEPVPSDDPPPAPAAVTDGETFAVLRVPRWGEDHALPVTEGIGLEQVLNTGAAGHYPGTALPGEVGNVALAGHRQSYGAPFRHVEQLQHGDALVLETADGWLVYRVSEDYVVTPDRIDVVAPVPGRPGAEPQDRLLTLTTCHPLFSAAQRWITHATFEEWYPRAGGEPTDLLEVS